MQPSNQTVTAGQNAQFNIIATGAQSLSYQWRLNGSSIVGATNFTFFKTSAQLGDAGGYSIVITNYLGSITSSVAQLTVNQPAVPPFSVLPWMSPTNGFNLSFTTVSNRIYTIEFTDVLPATNWQVLQTLPGNGTTWTVNYALTNGSRFFRVKVE
jgi:hypothetical protein